MPALLTLHNGKFAGPSRLTVNQLLRSTCSARPSGKAASTRTTMICTKPVNDSISDAKPTRSCKCS